MVTGGGHFTNRFEVIIDTFRNNRFAEINEEELLMSFNNWYEQVILEAMGSEKKQGTSEETVVQLFQSLVTKLTVTDNSKLLRELLININNYRHTDEEYYNLLKKYYKDWYGIKKFDIAEQSFTNFFGGHITYCRNNIQRFKKLFETLGDNRSKFTLITMLSYWTTCTPNVMKVGVEKTYEPYFDLDLFNCDKDEVFVDCGAYIGDTIDSYIGNYGDNYKKIYAYEITKSTFEKLKKNSSNYRDIDLRLKGVFSQHGEIPISECAADPGANRLANQGSYMGTVVALDEDITEPITFLKMDIEGVEAAAIMGAKNHIINDKPKLAICLYHKLEDILDLPELVLSINPNYKIYLRHYGYSIPIGFPGEYVLLAKVD